MFLLDELPSRQILKRFAAQYPNMEIDSVFACLHVLKLASVIIRDLEAYFGEFDLSMARFIVLVVLEREQNPQLTAADLSRKMGIAKKNVSRLLLPLEAQALIRREPSTDDARREYLLLTDKGRKKLKKALPGYYDIIQSYFCSLDKSAIKEVGRVFESILCHTSSQ